MLKELGHTVYLYASEENEAPCDELITVITKAEQEKALDGCPYQYAMLANKTDLFATSVPRTIKEIDKRKQPKDFLLIYGWTHSAIIAGKHPDMPAVEFHIGYTNSGASFRVFSSSAWQHLTYGQEKRWNGRHFDTVIPGFFDPGEFTFRDKKEPFALFVGRLVQKKGLPMACAAAKMAGLPLKVIGHGNHTLVTDGAEYLGALPADERNDWMSRAQVLICPTQYIEPFGNIAVESQMAGSPAVSTPFGGFTETIEHGRTGYHCLYLEEYAQALKDAAGLDHAYIRQRAIEKYSLHAVGQMYQQYFDRLYRIWSHGIDEYMIQTPALTNPPTTNEPAATPPTPE
jgi:glycosyltransferase involved in cell wall biosynthesis